MKTTTKTRSNTVSLTFALALAALPFAASCDDGALAEGTKPANVDESLKRLGVPMDSGPRLGVPEGYAPYGKRMTLKRADELFTTGFTVPPATAGGAFLQFDDAAAPLIMATVNQPWTAAAGVVRAAAAADIDGDGREETIVASSEPGATDLMLSIIEDSKAGLPFTIGTAPIARRAGVIGLVAAAADFTGDHVPDLVVGVTSQVDVLQPAVGSTPAAAVKRARAELLFLRNLGGKLVLHEVASKVLLPGVLDGPETASIALAPGRLDGDDPSELAVVVNGWRRTQGQDVWSAQQLVFDDAVTGYAQRAAGPIQIPGGVVTMGDVATGDIDGDGLDEVIFGGVIAAHDRCDGPGGKTTATIGAVALDDAAHAFAPLGATQFERAWGDCGDEVYSVQVRWAPVRALNADGDDGKEILVGDTLFDDFRSSAAWTRLGQLPAGSLVPAAAQRMRFAPDTAAVSVMWAKHVDKDAAGVETTTYGHEIAVVSQDLRTITRFRPVAQEGSDRIGFQAAAPALPVSGLQASANKAQWPVLLPVNVDDDTLEVRRADDTQKLVFTQPIVIAALAAPPCQTGIGQNTDACVTSFGTGTREAVEGELALSTSVGVTAGVKIDGSIFGEVEAKGTLTAKATLTMGAAYELSRSVTYETGALEDAVVFATVPYDQYNYVICAGPHAGEPMTVSLPRTPVVLIAERSFYNRSVMEGGLQIDENVFTHRTGDIGSYPNHDAVTRLASTGVKVVEDGPMGVGQGGSAVTLSHEVGTEYSAGAALELGFEFEAQVSGGGVLGGFSVGVSAEASLKVTAGSNTAYAGTVGSIDAEHFADNFYQYGLYTYVQTDPATRQRFEVLNWWVQR